MCDDGGVSEPPLYTPPLKRICHEADPRHPATSASASAGGDLVALVKAELDCCSICLDWLLDPCVGPCGHVYCLGCWDSWSASRMHASCPTCRTSFHQPLGVCLKLRAVTELLDPSSTARRKVDVAQRLAAADAACAVSALEASRLPLNSSLLALFLTQQHAALDGRHGAASTQHAAPRSMPVSTTAYTWSEVPTTPRSGVQPPNPFAWDHSTPAAAAPLPSAWLLPAAPLPSSPAWRATPPPARPSWAHPGGGGGTPQVAPPATPQQQSPVLVPHGSPLPSHLSHPLFIHTARTPVLADLDSWASPPRPPTALLLVSGTHLVCSTPLRQGAVPAARRTRRARPIPFPPLSQMTARDAVDAGDAGHQPPGLTASVGGDDQFQVFGTTYESAGEGLSALPLPAPESLSGVEGMPARQLPPWPGADLAVSASAESAIAGTSGAAQAPSSPPAPLASAARMAWQGSADADALLREACTFRLLAHVGVDVRLATPLAHVLQAVRECEAAWYSAAPTQAAYQDSAALGRQAQVLRFGLLAGTSTSHLSAARRLL